MGRTLDQRRNVDGLVKPGELIEVRQASALTLHDRRVLNLLVLHAGPRIATDEQHVVPMRELRPPTHRGGERVRDSIVRLMTTLVEVPTRDRHGNRATFRTALLAGTTTTDDEDAPGGEVTYSFSREMRDIIRNSQYWGRIKPLIMFAFSSKYAMALYEALCLRRNLDCSTQDFLVEDFRQIVGVRPGKLTGFPQLKQSVISPAVEEVNALSDFNVEVEPIRMGGRQRGTLTGFRVSWSVKETDEWLAVLGELTRPRAGRKARVRGEVEKVAVGGHG